MTKETAKQRIALHNLEYPERLMAVLARSTDAYFDLDVRDNKFRVTDRNNSDYWDLAYAHSSNSQERLEDLVWTLDQRDAAAAEAKRKDDLARAAFNKLSREEQEALGLNSRFNW
jgi:hypothetical protein